MKSILTKISILSSVAVTALTIQLNAVPIGISTSFGAVNPATPSNATAETNFINNLRLISPVGENAPSFPALLDDGTFLNTGGTVYDRFNVGGLPAGPLAVTAGSIDGVASASLNLGAVGSWTYLYAKFGNTAYVWNVSGLGGPIELPTTLGQAGGLSHHSLYNRGATVPEGGTTVALLGLALGLLAVARRKFGI